MTKFGFLFNCFLNSSIQGKKHAVGPITNKQLIERSWYITNSLMDWENLENIAKKFEIAINKSIIYHNNKILKCKYNKDILQNIFENKKNLYC